MTYMWGYTEQDIFYLHTMVPPYHGQLVSTSDVFFNNISETMLATNMYDHTSLERYFYTASAAFVA